MHTLCYTGRNVLFSYSGFSFFSISVCKLDVAFRYCHALPKRGEKPRLASSSGCPLPWYARNARTAADRPLDSCQERES